MKRAVRGLLFALAGAILLGLSRVSCSTNCTEEMKTCRAKCEAAGMHTPTLDACAPDRAPWLGGYSCMCLGNGR